MKWFLKLIQDLKDKKFTGAFTIRFNFSHGKIGNVNKKIEETFTPPEE